MEREIRIMKHTWAIVLAIFACNVAAGQETLHSVAVKGLIMYWKNIPDGLKCQYGFASIDSLKDVHLEEPLNLSQITPTSLDNYKEGDSTESLLSKTELWYFPLSVNNEIKCIIVVDKVDDGFRAVSFGYASLAGEIDALKHTWPASNGYRFHLVVAFQANSYLYTIPELNNHNLSIIELTDSSKSVNSVNVLDVAIKGTPSSTVEQLKRRIYNHADSIEK
jgi:hypothetical protein